MRDKVTCDNGIAKYECVPCTLTNSGYAAYEGTGMRITYPNRYCSTD